MPEEQLIDTKSKMSRRTTLFVAVALGLLASMAFAAELPAKGTYTNSLSMKFVRVEPGRFAMGFGRRRLPEELITQKTQFADGDFDEHPTHTVKISKPFYAGMYEVTNAQYEQFDPSHKKYRGRNGFSKADDEAVVFLSWNDAAAFCQWLSEKEGLPYRLPTEAEWEYACRAGTTTYYHTGDILPDEFHKSSDGASLQAGKTAPNLWGLYDMHGNVEEWCYDWYGPYESTSQVDPIGRVDGDFKVTRGGSHSTELYYLRSANRLGSHPNDRQWMIGFRVVLGEMPETKPLPISPLQRYQRNVRQKPSLEPAKAPDPHRPYFRGPRLVVKIPKGSRGPLFDEHNHFMAVTECPNGDLLAAWFTCMEEMGRELGIAASRLRYGTEQWGQASPFWDCPDRNDHTHALWYDGKGTLYHFNGLGLKHRRLAVALRKSKDNGATWSKAKLILPDHGKGTGKVVESVFRAKGGEIVLPMDGRGGSIIQISPDEGRSWYDPGGSIRGTHAGVVQLADGRLMAFGRHGAIDGRMPISISSDMGKTWTYSPSPFQPIHSGRRVALMRLKQGPLFFASFGHEMTIKDVSGKLRSVSGLFAAVSLDEGKTWSYRRLISDDGPSRYIETMDGDPITMDARSAEPTGYLSVCQSVDGLIHLLSSRQHYAFNLKWLVTPPPTAPPPPPPPKALRLPIRHNLPNIYKPKGLPSKDEWGWDFRGGLKESDVISLSPEDLLKFHTNDRQQFWLRTEKADIFGAVDPKKGFTAEIKTQVLKRTANQRGVDLELYDGAGSRYAITITDTGVYWYEGLVQGSAFLPFSQYVALAEGLDNTDRMHTYRIAVRRDRVAQIYRDGKLLGVKPFIYRTPRFPYIYVGAGPGVEALVEYVAYDLSGPSQP
jgi:formylglycine-generating enzyme required for sulfatase activity